MPTSIAASDTLGEQICELAAQLNAATCQLLEMIARFDTERGWAKDGCRSCAHWLNWKCGIGMTAAREKVRVAGLLSALPKIHAAFARGELSYSKVRAMTRVATEESQDYLLMIARHGTAAHLEFVVRGYRRVQRRAELAAANEAYEQRSLSWCHDEDGMLVFTVRLAPEDGARLLYAVRDRQRALDEENKDTEGASAESPIATRRADALMDLITHKQDTEVVVHVSADALTDDSEDGECKLEDGPTLPPESARRLACDAGIVRLVEDPDGQPLDVGRKTRSIPPALKRALKARDGGCRFPGCASTHGVQGHHIRHWAHGGETSLSNVIQVCHWHHRAVHEGGFTVQRTADGDFCFLRPDGSVIDHAPSVTTVDGRADLILRKRNQRHGIHVDGTSAAPHWDGQPMDRAMAVEGMLSVTGNL